MLNHQPVPEEAFNSLAWSAKQQSTPFIMDHQIPPHALSQAPLVRRESPAGRVHVQPQQVGSPDGLHGVNRSSPVTYLPALVRYRSGQCSHWDGPTEPTKPAAASAAEVAGIRLLDQAARLTRVSCAADGSREDTG
jgi:hypothetical protein